MRNRYLTDLETAVMRCLEAGKSAYRARSRSDSRFVSQALHRLERFGCVTCGHDLTWVVTDRGRECLGGVPVSPIVVSFVYRHPPEATAATPPPSPSDPREPPASGQSGSKE
jgi:hypothetical protein